MTAPNADEMIGLQLAYQAEVGLAFRGFHCARYGHGLVSPESVVEAERQFQTKIARLREDYSTALMLMESIQGG